MATLKNGIDLLDDERVVFSTGDDALVLTNRRVRFDAGNNDARKVVGITLDAVASCGIAARSYSLLLLLAGIAFVGAAFQLFNEEGAMALGAVVLGFILILAYLLTRNATLTIASAGEAIHVRLTRSGPDALLEALNAIETAKLVSLRSESPALPQADAAA